MTQREKRARARLDRALLAYHEIVRTFGEPPANWSGVVKELHSAEVGLYQVLCVKGRAE